MESIWNNIEKQRYGIMEGDIKTDVLIIGGGMCGILCAYMLKNAGVDCVLVEAERICSGITNGTTAKVTIQHGIIYDKIIKKYGVEKAQMYYKSQRDAYDMIAKLAENMDADFESSDSFVYSLSDNMLIENEVEALNRIGCDAEFCKNIELPFDIAGAVKVKNQGKIHPLKLAYGLADKLKIYEQTKVIKINPKEVITNKGRISADKIIVATHFPFINKYGGYFLKMYQHRSYVLALKNAQLLKGMYVDAEKNGLSFRGYSEWLLLGGGGHRTGNIGGSWEELQKFADKHYPDSDVVGMWATQDCITLDAIPYIGRYSKTTSDLYVATGFNKWGMTSSMVSAMMMTDMICGRKSEFEELYSPSRTMIHPQLALNIFESAKGLITPKAPRCPHMGCVLKYNKQEHSWDCPCHGSRFDENGELIDNPATRDKTNLK